MFDFDPRDYDPAMTNHTAMRRAVEVAAPGIPIVVTTGASPEHTFTRHVRLPRGPKREIVRDCDREYTERRRLQVVLARPSMVWIISDAASTTSSENRRSLLALE